MRRLLLIILFAVILYGCYYMVAEGTQFYLSFAEFSTSNQHLKTVVENTVKIKQDIENKANELEQEKKRFGLKNNQFNILVSENEALFKKTVDKEEYFLEYIWIKFGNYALQNSQNIVIQIKDRDLYITLTGPYLGLVNCIYDIEEELDLKVDDLVIEGAKDGKVKAVFTVKNMNIIY